MDTKPSNFESEYLQLEKEKIRARRQTNFYILIGVIACLGLYLALGRGKGNAEIDIRGGKFKFSVDESITEQAKVVKENTELGGKEINYTTGSVKENDIEKLEKQNINISPTRFTGKNLINREAGFTLSSKNPKKYNVGYNPLGLSNPMVPVNTITSPSGNVNITRSTINNMYTFREQIEGMLLLMQQAGLITQIPNVQYDDSNTVAFLTYTNQQTGGVSYQKVIQAGDFAYAATANYNSALTPASEQDDLINMVASLTPIED